MRTSRCLKQGSNLKTGLPCLLICDLITRCMDDTILFLFIFQIHFIALTGFLYSSFKSEG